MTIEKHVKDPHHLLGLHNKGQQKVIRLWRPGATQTFIEVNDVVKKAKCVDETGLFEVLVEDTITASDYRITHEAGLSGCDPYAFMPTFTKEDEELFAKGKHEKIHEAMGGRLIEHQGVRGVKFAVWAPCAKGVFLVGDFNHWNEALHPMRLMGASGVWELFIPGLGEGEKYKFYIVDQEGYGHFKADPYGYQGEMRPNTASVVTSIDRHEWNDQEWMEKRKETSWLERPINIYEVHLGSWKMRGFDFMNYREIAPHLAEYCQNMGYTHVEFMPVMSHPLDESWGYQVTGFYAISSRFGTVEDFQYLVDCLHQANIGVLFDWVPAHFPTDEHSIARFDGTYLYEHLDPRQGYHPQWNTHIFNYGRFEVYNFLIGSALYFFEVMHLDGFRVDAVSSMVYLDYERKEGDWLPNKNGTNENLEAITFLKDLNQIVHEKFPGILMIAEESHAYPNVTLPVSQGGLGFDLKWGLGWMHDTLNYFQTKAPFRPAAQKMLTHEFSYYYDEKYLLCLSHDEVVHEKKSLLSKMGGSEWERFANLRLLMSYMICHPGKKLLFMGGEFGQWHEWDCKEELHWALLQMPFHRTLQNCVRALNHLYLKHPALWERDFEEEALTWIETEGVFSYVRHGKEQKLLCVHNFSENKLESFHLAFNEERPLIEIFNSDSQEYGGYGIINEKIERDTDGIVINLAPFSTTIIQYADEK